MTDKCSFRLVCAAGRLAAFAMLLQRDTKISGT